ncbi:hypothetical protein AVEN_48214-1 [Araneus ventricosus]|uniref:Uncharacterized protein n=1 Tax=Araneus ventricosus TaxID=182803 RepID=A0A4Y2SC16_ARAVE|nr:hypothetical protein AVEN_48214-1 [Araneus ventricosus]
MLKVNTVVAGCSDQGCNDQSVILIQIAQNGSSISKLIENLPVLVISFDETKPQNMRKMTRGHKRNHHRPKKLYKPFLQIVQCNTMLNLLMSINHTKGYFNEYFKTKKLTGYPK